MGCTATALLGVVASRSPLRSAGCLESSGPTLTGATLRQQRSLAPGLSTLGRAMAALAMHKLLPLKTQRGEVICVCSQSRVHPRACRCILRICSQAILPCTLLACLASNSNLARSLRRVALGPLCRIVSQWLDRVTSPWLLLAREQALE